MHKGPSTLSKRAVFSVYHRLILCFMCTQTMRNHLPFPPLSTLPHSLQHQQNQLITPFFWTGSKSWTHAGDVFQALESAQTVITFRLHSFSIMHFFSLFAALVMRWSVIWKSTSSMSCLLTLRMCIKAQQHCATSDALWALPAKACKGQGFMLLVSTMSWTWTLNWAETLWACVAVC